MQGKTSTFSLTAIGLLLLLSCCKQPIQPVVEPPLNFDEPDTIKSSISFILTAPFYTSYRWQGKLPSDTLSKERITSTGMRASAGVILQDGINFSHAIKSNFCSLSMGKAFDLITQDYQRPGDMAIYALRYWNSIGWRVSYNKLPQAIIVPIKLDSLSTFSWSNKQYQEQFVNGNSPTSWSILPFVSDIFSELNYWRTFWQRDTTFYSIEERNLYRTHVEQAEFYLDRYDTVRQRVDGRFSFRMVGYDGRVVDIRNGRFLNVRLNRTRD